MNVQKTVKPQRFMAKIETLVPQKIRFFVRPIYLLGAISVPLVIWQLFFWSALDKFEGIFSDSAGYIDCARAIFSGQGILTRTEFGLDPKLWAPFFIQPPGYPLSVAGFQWLSGISAMQSGVIVSAFSGAVSLILIFGICRKVMPIIPGMVVTTLVAAMFPFVVHSSVCLSDSLALAVSTAAIFCIFLALENRRSLLWWWVSGGVLCGFSLCIRYAGLALVVGTSLFLLLNIFWEKWRNVYRWVLCWTFGLVIGAGPLFLRNFVFFGNILPYDRNSSPVTLEALTKNFKKHMVDQYLNEMFFWNQWSVFYKYFVGGFVSVLVLSFVIIFVKKNFGQIRSFFDRHRGILYLWIYLLVYLAIVIFSQTRYFLGGYLGRFGLQVYWIFWLSIIFSVLYVFDHFKIARQYTTIALVAFCLVITGAHLQNSYLMLRQKEEQKVVDEKVITFLKKNVSSKQIILATHSVIFRCKGDINAQNFPSRDSTLTSQQIENAGREGLLWGIIITGNQINAMREGRFGKAIIEILANMENFGFKKINNLDPTAIVLKYTNNHE